jgi:hypothetical protein
MKKIKNITIKNNFFPTLIFSTVALVNVFCFCVIVDGVISGCVIVDGDLIFFPR